LEISFFSGIVFFLGNFFIFRFFYRNNQAEIIFGFKQGITTNLLECDIQPQYHPLALIQLWLSSEDKSKFKQKLKPIFTLGAAFLVDFLAFAKKINSEFPPQRDVARYYIPDGYSGE
jgi:hypothetical protein